MRRTDLLPSKAWNSASALGLFSACLLRYALNVLFIHLACIPRQRTETKLKRIAADSFLLSAIIAKSADFQLVASGRKAFFGRD